MGAPSAKKTHRRRALPDMGGKFRHAWRRASREAARRCCGDKAQTPFLLAFLFALQSESMPLLPLASRLAKASKGYWNGKQKVFQVAQRNRHAGASLETQWIRVTEDMPSFGVVSVHFTGAHITSFQFAEPWALTQVQQGKNFLPDAYLIPLRATGKPFALLDLGGKDSSYLSLALGEWEKVMGTRLVAELRIVQEGRFAISRAELPLTQVVFKNHPSSESNPEARAALWPGLAQYLVLGQFEYVPPGAPLPLAILPIGHDRSGAKVDSALVATDSRLSLLEILVRFIDRWPISYLLGCLCSSAKNCFFCVADMKAAYLLTRLGGCWRPPMKVKLYKTNESQNGYVEMVEWEGETTGCTSSC
jgi:hypothetical protein